MSVKLKVFTFNVRYPTEQDGINCFDNRKEKILAVINEYAPDLIGFQEANDKSVGYLRSALTDYTVIGCGRNAEYRGEGTYIPMLKLQYFVHLMRKASSLEKALMPGKTEDRRRRG